MLVALNFTEKSGSGRIRGILGRYLWRVGRDVWIWPYSSIMDDVIEELDRHSKYGSVVFYWKRSTKNTGFESRVFGSHPSPVTDFGLFDFKGMK